MDPSDFYSTHIEGERRKDSYTAGFNDGLTKGFIQGVDSCKPLFKILETSCMGLRWALEQQVHGPQCIPEYCDNDCSNCECAINRQIVEELLMTCWPKTEKSESGSPQ